MRIRILVLLVGCCIATGCSKRTPVQEITVDQSGIAIEEIVASDIDLPWPQWRGGNGGVVRDNDIPTSWDENNNVRWQADVAGRGHSSPIVVGDLVVLGSATEQPAQQVVVAYDRKDGQQKWKTIVHDGGLPAGQAVHQKATNANSTLASDGTHLVTAHLNSDHIWVTSLDLQGKQVWQKDIGAFSSKFGYAPSPILFKSLVIVAADNQGGGYLVGLDIRSGEIAWRRSRGNQSSYSSPALVSLGGTEQVVITGADCMASYDPATGELNWETNCISEATCGTVIATDDKVIGSGGYPDKETVCLDANGKRLWSNRTKVYEPSMVTDGANVFAVTDDGIAYCWSIEDGETRWKKRLGGNFSSSPILCQGRIYVSDLSGSTYVFEASGDEYKLVSKNQLGDDCYASPAVAADAMFLRVGFGAGESRREKLFCVGASL